MSASAPTAAAAPATVTGAESPVAARVTELSQVLDSIQEEVASLDVALISVLAEEGENCPEELRAGPDGECSPLARELYCQCSKAEEVRNALRNLRRRLTI